MFLVLKDYGTEVGLNFSPDKRRTKFIARLKTSGIRQIVFFCDASTIAKNSKDAAEYC